MLAQKILNRALALMPETDGDWAQAMHHEFEVARKDGKALDFALGCLNAAVLAYARTRTGLALIGRGAVAVGLLTVGAVGWLIGFENAAAARLIQGLCAFYAIGGILSLWSVRALRLYASAGLACAALSWVSIRTILAGRLGEMEHFAAALSLECAAIMGALLFVALFLSLLQDPPARETHAG